MPTDELHRGDELFTLPRLGRSRYQCEGQETWGLRAHREEATDGVSSEPAGTDGCFEEGTGGGICEPDKRNRAGLLGWKQNVHSSVCFGAD